MRAQPTPASDVDRDTATLSGLNEDYIASVQNSDVRRFEQILSEDFLNTNPDGTLVDRAGFLAQIAKPIALSGLAAEDVRIRVLGDVGIVHARTTFRLPDGRAGSGRYTDVWQRRNGRWLCIAAHVSRG